MRSFHGPAFALSLLTACSSSSKKPPGSDGGILGTSGCTTSEGPGTEHAGTISADETWTAAGSPHHVTGDLDIRGATVSIEKCAVVNVASGAVISVGETSGAVARLVASGDLTVDDQTQ